MSCHKENAPYFAPHHCWQCDLPRNVPEEFSRSWVETLTHRLEILGCNLSFQTQEFSAASVPSTFDRPILVVVVALLEMALSVAFTAGHGTNRQHHPRLALFEFWIQGELLDS
jgi:hypothetical protein